MGLSYWAQVGTEYKITGFQTLALEDASFNRTTGFCIPSCLVPELRTGISRDVGGLSDDGFLAGRGGLI